MSAPPLVVSPNTTIGQIARLLTSERISGVPVVDENSRVVGMVTHADLFVKEKGVPFSLVKAPSLFGEWADASRLPEIYAASAGRTASEVMSRDVLCVDVNEDLGEVAQRMMRRKVCRAPVLKDGKLAGIITTHDLLRSFFRQ